MKRLFTYRWWFRHQQWREAHSWSCISPISFFWPDPSLTNSHTFWSYPGGTKFPLTTRGRGTWCVRLLWPPPSQLLAFSHIPPNVSSFTMPDNFLFKLQILSSGELTEELCKTVTPGQLAKLEWFPNTQHLENGMWTELFLSMEQLASALGKQKR